MKKSFCISLIFLVFLVLFSACNNSDNINGSGNTIKGSGKLITQERNLSECNGINLRYAGNIYLKQDSIQSVKVEADDNIIDNVITQNQGSILIAGLQNGSYSDVTVRIYISLISIENLTIDGAGNIEIQNDINCDNLSCIINGAGDINLSGKGDLLSCIIKGAGNINAFNFEVRTCQAKIKGTGNCSVYAARTLNAEITGVGNIVYDGNPVVVSSITGIGNITGR